MSENPYYDKALAEYKTELALAKKHEPLTDWEWALAKNGFNAGWRKCGESVLKESKKWATNQRYSRRLKQ